MTLESATMPIRKTAILEVGVERAFEVFTSRIGDWWPTATHSIHGEHVAEVVFERREGGRVFERTAGGEEADWARILAWEPPSRIVLEWRVDPTAAAPTEVEVRFRAENGGTRVELVHRGWERLGDAGEDGRRSYDGGWDGVLDRYREHANA